MIRSDPVVHAFSAEGGLPLAPSHFPIGFSFLFDESRLDDDTHVAKRGPERAISVIRETRGGRPDPRITERRGVWSEVNGSVICQGKHASTGNDLISVRERYRDPAYSPPNLSSVA